MSSILLETTTPSLLSPFAGELTTDSPIFYRPQSLTDDYYYFQAIQVTLSTSGTYTFRSNSTIDTRGYFYNTSFDPSNATVNLMADNDDAGGQMQFSIQVSLQSGQTYILVVTTHKEYTTGSFLVSAVGPAVVSLTSITPSTSRPIIIRKLENWNYGSSFVVFFYLICHAKVLAQNVKRCKTVLPTSKSFKFFLLERAMSELQVLYQTYFSRTNLRGRKSQKTKHP